MLILWSPWLAQATRGLIFTKYIRLYLLHWHCGLVLEMPSHHGSYSRLSLAFSLMRYDEPGIGVRLRRSYWASLPIRFRLRELDIFLSSYWRS